MFELISLGLQHDSAVDESAGCCDYTWNTALFLSWRDSTSLETFHIINSYSSDIYSFSSIWTKNSIKMDDTTMITNDYSMVLPTTAWISHSQLIFLLYFLEWNDVFHETYHHWRQNDDVLMESVISVKGWDLIRGESCRESVHQSVEHSEYNV